jgi:hypothetical protein
MSRKPRLLLLAALAVFGILASILVIAVLRAQVPDESEAMYRVQRDHWKQLRQQIIDLREEMRRSEITTQKLEQLQKLDAQCDVVFRWCKRWEIAHGRVVDNDRAANETVQNH